MHLSDVRPPTINVDFYLSLFGNKYGHGDKVGETNHLPLNGNKYLTKKSHLLLENKNKNNVTFVATVEGDIMAGVLFWFCLVNFCCACSIDSR